MIDRKEQRTPNRTYKKLAAQWWQTVLCSDPVSYRDAYFL